MKEQQTLSNVTSKEILVFSFSTVTMFSVINLLGYYAIDYGFIFAWSVHFILMGWASASEFPWNRFLGSSWFYVRDNEKIIYSKIGLKVYTKILDIIGWNRTINKTRDYDVTRIGIKRLDKRTRQSEAGHVACFLVSTIIAGISLFGNHWSAFSWLIVLAVIFHLYPIALQRKIRIRIQKLNLI